MSPLLIAYPSAEARHGLILPLLVSSNSSPVSSSRYEPAGVSFHSLALHLLGLEPSENEENEENLKQKVSASTDSSFEFKGKKKVSAEGEQDHYALLGLSHLRYLANEDQIRKSYRECALKFHPDKQASLLLSEESEDAKLAKKEEIDHHFKSIQKAYEVLIDPVKRRIYDSTDEFDDDVPSDCSPQDFFKIYGPVFIRNAKWSVVQQAPFLGDENTPLNEVDKFYDFWNSFRSWREFPEANEYDLDEAESREHKRWMERQNTKSSEKARKEESARIRSIVENAYKRDPRILKRREDEKAEKNRKKEARIQAKRDKENEIARLIEEERLKKEQDEKKASEEAAAKRKLKERERKLLRKEKSKLRSVASDVIKQTDIGITEEDIEDLCTRLDIDVMRLICEQIEGKNVEEKGLVLKQAFKDLESSVQASSATISLKDIEKSVGSIAEKSKSSSTGINEKKEKPWSKEEVELLRKAIQKYPKGTSQRWEVVSSYIGTNRMVDEILKAIKTVLLQKPDSSKAFGSFLEKRKVSNVVISSPLSTRDDSIVEPSIEPDSSNSLQCGVSIIEKSKEVDNSSVELSDFVKNEEKGHKKIVLNGIEAMANGRSIRDEQDMSWSDVQESSLVKALKAFPKDTPQRWDRIAAAVQGKSKTQCFRKFSELKENFRSKKNAE